MSSPRAAAELAAIVLLPAVSARLRGEAGFAPALESLRENLRAVRATDVLVNRGGRTVLDFERVIALPADVRDRIAETGRKAAEALADAWARGAPLVEVMLPVVARARGVSRLRHEPVIRRQMLKDAPDVLFVFGDNLRRIGMGGQAAEMRGEPNAVGIPTKIAPSMAPDAFFTDADLSKALDAFAEGFAKLDAHLRTGGTIVVPEAGIGTGRAQLEQRAPTIHAVLTRAMDALDRMAAGDHGARSPLAVIEETRQALAGTSKETAPVVATASTAHGRLTYTGIGSRDTPPTELARMEEVAAILQRQGWTLRSGGAEGADSAFERGADRAARKDGTTARKEIYIPWNGFQRRSDQETGVILASALPNAREAMEMAKRYHPAWERLRQGARLLQSRNGHQILGRDLDDPSDVVICWTDGGTIKGGTGQALRIAQDLGIPVLNLGDPRWRDATPETLANEVARLALQFAAKPVIATLAPPFARF